ncbi:hypothetical protein ACWFRJ_41545 [Streptomyces sp. NPDC055239]
MVVRRTVGTVGTVGPVGPEDSGVRFGASTGGTGFDDGADSEAHGADDGT